MDATSAVALGLALGAHWFYNKKDPSTLKFIGYSTLLAASTFLFALWMHWNHASPVDLAFFTLQFMIQYFTFLLLSVGLYRLSPLHPLYAFPGPLTPRLSKWWMVHRILIKGGRHTTLQELHRQYGPWLRIGTLCGTSFQTVVLKILAGPNELSVNLPAAIRPIYNRLDRGPFYEGTPAKAESLITVMDRKRHLERRQVWARAVTSEALLGYVPYVENRCQELKNHLLVQGKQHGIVNLDQWTNLFFMDLMGDMGFSGGFETMAAGKDKDGWMEMLAMGVVFVSSMGQVPWLRDIFQLLPQRGPIQTFHSFTEDKVREIRDLQKLGTMRRDILSTLLDDTKSVPLAHDEIAADATLIVVAATDTSVQTVLTLLRYLCEHPEKYERLQQEVGQAFSEVAATQVLDLKTLLNLEYLDACIQESLRIVPPGPFGPPRTSGPNGTRILDKWIPPNTTVHVPVWTMHRDPDNFLSPDDFLPERWLADEGADLHPCNREACIPFSFGYASCLGKNLALQNIKILVAHIVYAFNVRLTPEFDAKKYDASFKEYGLWSHNPLYIKLEAR